MYLTCIHVGVCMYLTCIGLNVHVYNYVCLLNNNSIKEFIPHDELSRWMQYVCNLDLDISVYSQKCEVEISFQYIIFI